MAFKVGDYVIAASNYGKRLTKGKSYQVVGISGPCYWVVDNLGNTDGWPKGQWEPAGPVRTVTRREIVDGTYGPLEVARHEGGTVLVGLTAPDVTLVALNATELDSLAMVASQLAEVLREQG